MLMEIHCKAYAQHVTLERDDRLHTIPGAMDLPKETLKVREILRYLLIDKRLPQKSWRQTITGLSFALNASKSFATRYAPF